MNVLGLMSGTSVDGIDAALVRIEEAGQELSVRLLAYRETPHDEALRARVLALFDPARSRIDETTEVNVRLGESFAAAAQALLDESGLSADLIASHGQTVWHQVRDGVVTGTLQLGEPSVIAERLGVTVVADFRPRDVAAGGQGAPLASYPDTLLLADPVKARAIQNLGGIGNVTYLPPGGDPTATLAFDTGPGNALIDHAVSEMSGARYDQDGHQAAAGRIDDTVLDELLAHPYFAQPPPKSTGRELFGAAFAERVMADLARRGATSEDVVATLTRFTARTIADQYRRFLPRMPDEIVLGGGGARNATLRRWIGEELGRGVRLLDHDNFGLPSSGREAIYFAVIGYQTLHGRPNTVPACTGAHHAVVMGKLLPGPNYPALVGRIRPDVTIKRLRIEESTP